MFASLNHTLAPIGAGRDGAPSVGKGRNVSCLQLSCGVPRPVAPRYTAKIGLVAEEADESVGWLEFIEAARLLTSPELIPLIVESRELSAIMSASFGTARYKERNGDDDNRRRR